MAVHRLPVIHLQQALMLHLLQVLRHLLQVVLQALVPEYHLKQRLGRMADTGPGPGGKLLLVHRQLELLLVNLKRRPYTTGPAMGELPPHLCGSSYTCPTCARETRTCQPHVLPYNCRCIDSGRPLRRSAVLLHEALLTNCPYT